MPISKAAILKAILKAKRSPITKELLKANKITWELFKGALAAYAALG